MKLSKWVIATLGYTTVLCIVTENTSLDALVVILTWPDLVSVFYPSYLSFRLFHAGTDPEATLLKAFKQFDEDESGYLAED